MQGVAVAEVDFHLRGAFLVDQGVQIQALRLAPGVHVLEQRVELVGGIDRERLAAGLLAPGAAHRRLQRVVGVVAALGQVELHFRRDDRLPALLGVQRQHVLEHVARRQVGGVADLVVAVVDHQGGRLGGPGHQEHGVVVRAAEHVDVGRVEQLVEELVLDVVAGDALQQHALRQAHAAFGEELAGRRDLAAGDAVEVADQALHLDDPAFLQPAAQPVLLASHNNLARR
ncbi:hypothetical protein D3C81_1279700 [compost metagenome]